MCRCSDLPIQKKPHIFSSHSAHAYEHLFRFGPGRLSRRHHQTERLQALRARKASGPTQDDSDITPLLLSRESVGRNRPETQQLVGGDTKASITDTSNKRRRGESSGGARELLRQRFSEKAPSEELALVRKKSAPLASESTSDATSKLPRDTHEDNVSGVARAGIRCNTPAARKDAGIRVATRCNTPAVHRSTRAISSPMISPVRSAPASRRPRAGKAAGMSRSMTDDTQRANTAQQCGRSLSRSLTDAQRDITTEECDRSLSRSMVDMQRDNTTQQEGVSQSMTDAQRDRTKRKCDRSLSRSMSDPHQDITAQKVSMSRSMMDLQRDIAARRSDLISGRQQHGDDGNNAGKKTNVNVGIESFSSDGNNHADGDYGNLAGSGDATPTAPPDGSSIDKPGLEYPGIPGAIGYPSTSGVVEYPGIAGACGGIVLRLNPAERSLEPWSSAVTPFRAMCDIEPSLSRAGLECRGVINAVEAAQEMKLQDRAKVRKAKAKRCTYTVTLVTSGSARCFFACFGRQSCPRCCSGLTIRSNKIV